MLAIGFCVFSLRLLVPAGHGVHDVCEASCLLRLAPHDVGGILPQHLVSYFHERHHIPPEDACVPDALGTALNEVPPGELIETLPVFRKSGVKIRFHKAHQLVLLGEALLHLPGGGLERRVRQPQCLPGDTFRAPRPKAGPPRPQSPGAAHGQSP